MTERVYLPAELHALAAHPAIPAIPAIYFEGQGLRGERKYKLIPPAGGHTLLDFYFQVAFAAAFSAMVGVRGEAAGGASDEELDGVAVLAWRAAISAVRRRPNTGAVPDGVPEKGVE